MFHVGIETETSNPDGKTLTKDWNTKEAISFTAPIYLQRSIDRGTYSKSGGNKLLSCVHRC